MTTYLLRILPVVAVLAYGLTPDTAAACTMCDSYIGQQVRDLIGSEGFYVNLFALLLPFPVLLSVIGCVHCGACCWPHRESEKRSSAQHDMASTTASAR